jgi:hypothetical protein
MRNKSGRPALAAADKRSIKVVFYINESEKEKLDNLKQQLSSRSPALSINSFFRKVLNSYDDTLLDFLDLSPIDEVKQHLKLKRSYNKAMGD